MGETWRGLVIEPEDRCSPYRGSDYSYPPSVEPKIVTELGKIYSPYTGQCFSSMRQTDIEHIVARSEAHDSGLCRADIAARKKFSSDLLNLTLADPKLNRHQKRAYDAAEWMPEINRCWFANRVLQVRLKYGLSIDRREAEALERILSTCTTFAIEKSDCVAVSDLPASRPASPLQRKRRPCAFGTTTGMEESPAVRRAAMALRPCHADIPPIRSCTMVTAMAWSASNRTASVNL